MPLKQQLTDHLKDALRAGDAPRRDTLRLLLSSLHNAEIEAGDELDDAAVLGVLAKEAKQRRESIEEFKKAARQELVDREEAELALIAAYLPEQLTREEIVAAARTIIEETGASGPQDLGKVMPALMQQLRGRADGREANDVVRELLSGS
ncbi:MAG: GatB/YqeY domain-containing protein [Dehalococcoidia bacterium]